ncbi:MAG: bifunctional 3-phenylpropionate/cinnamic acid dioxygenase ferredoxin subunit [Microbacterium ginsengisoli]|jgi:3-phenylpropionate/trans-cinnamate dioxygenase ferredoxin subunit|uniref:bifunctional 3-phenylpropionate/cinnamic acid dioxygenase ferredoxin subunit n=1 Tax=Microbacterium TaxID=33882 RepID=UPI0006F97563|nr:MULTISPECIES: bifunctional 3-phenylpropionate/cinnamic acid dioxygenase ferredoxin subunit [Microbacterium]MBN9197199.1 bifunctional 3-phenylpropionate/cinnamic acid dioxygenase ferredoxin subunit [Microbacterium ginsengisoli]KQR91141.1 2Fe-2S ferredoxin [Microbacterium sp. Leaf347]KQS01153.1 2Fe-2S ferredoxin [Microbacterium sp. Leaf351]KXC07202.1 2Fe-2S ferredoxin [Microbacterium hominis]MBN9208649.1 bifunctional 3-phenylpropionate/cinnamic acid dioxygenase ferredoxin subunit [Microbacter
MAEGIVVADIDDVPEGEGIKIDAAVTGTVDDIAVFNDDGEFFALDDTCSHEKASLSEGWLENGVVECPLHAGKFCLKDGAVMSMPATEDVACHRVIIDGSQLRVVPNPARLA